MTQHVLSNLYRQRWLGLRAHGSKYSRHLRLACSKDTRLFCPDKAQAHDFTVSLGSLKRFVYQMEGPDLIHTQTRAP